MALARTLLKALIQKLQGCNVQRDAEEAPVAIHWTDPRSEWKPLVPYCGSSCPSCSACATTPSRLVVRPRSGPRHQRLGEGG